MAGEAETHWYAKAKINMARKKVDMQTDTIKMSLHTEDYTPDQDEDEHKDDLSHEISVAGYTAGGETLINKAITYDPLTKMINYTCNDIEIASAGLITFRYAVFYSDAGDFDDTKVLLGYCDYGEDMVMSDGVLTLHFEDGIYLQEEVE